MRELTNPRKRLLDSLFARGAVKFGEFKLKLHEKNPSAPLSPIYITLRLPDNGGPLTSEDVWEIGQEMSRLVREMGLDFDLVAGIPRAGEPFANVVSQLSCKPLLRFHKREEGGQRRIDSGVEGDYYSGQTVLLVDDLITKADTKKEAIAACESAGLIVCGVVVLVDRQQGGAEELEREGYPVYSVFALEALLKYYLGAGRIDQAKYNEVVAYIKQS